MALNLLPLGTLGATENKGVVTFGLWLPWVSAADGNVVSVKVIHEARPVPAGHPAAGIPADAQRARAVR